MCSPAKAILAAMVAELNISVWRLTGARIRSFFFRQNNIKKKKNRRPTNGAAHVFEHPFFCPGYPVAAELLFLSSWLGCCLVFMPLLWLPVLPYLVMLFNLFIVRKRSTSTMQTEYSPLRLAWTSGMHLAWHHEWLTRKYTQWTIWDRSGQLMVGFACSPIYFLFHFFLCLAGIQICYIFHSI